MEYYVGLMSGTSLDGVDAVLVEFGARRPGALGNVHYPFSDELRNNLLSLNDAGPNELHRASLAANVLAETYAGAIKKLLAQLGWESNKVRAIGCHGQTVRHRPELGYSIQLVNGAVLAEQCGIDVVCDFRSRDIAAGGQGAPLVPAFHNEVFRDAKNHRVIVNIGGISNLTDLTPKAAIQGFDCGPGNILMDAWNRECRSTPYDENGAWAKSGNVLTDLLNRFLQEAFFYRAPPKSTGRETFNLDWIKKQLNGNEAPEDVQATLSQLAVKVIATATQNYCPDTNEIYLCGGGAYNGHLVDGLARAVAPTPVQLTDVLGIKANLVEACAFAWLAWRTINKLPGNLPSATGAKGERILGAIYRAS